MEAAIQLNGTCQFEAGHMAYASVALLSIGDFLKHCSFEQNPHMAAKGAIAALADSEKEKNWPFTTIITARPLTEKE